MLTAESIDVEVVFLSLDHTFRRPVRLPIGATVERALASSGLDEASAHALQITGIGIFGKLVSRQAPLRDGDRVELYRSLAQGPKEARRQRARK